MKYPIIEERPLKDETAYDLIISGYEEDLAKILRYEGWKEEEIRSYIMTLLNSKE